MNDARASWRATGRSPINCEEIAVSFFGCFKGGVDALEMVSLVDRSSQADSGGGVGEI